MRAFLGLLALTGLAGVLWWSVPAAPLPARFAAADCRSVSLVDARSGKTIRGVEDIAPAGDALILSAYDRLAAEAGRPAGGGVYRLALSDIATAGGAAPVDLLAPERGEPHGIAVSDGRLAVILRDHDAGGHASTGVLVATLGPEALQRPRRYRDPRLCAANDLVWFGEALHLTLDRRDCPGLSLRDAVFAQGGRTARLAPSGKITILREGLSHPNGLVPFADGIAVAETRASRLSLPDGRTVDLPGGPDNLSAAPGGGIVVALHPDLLRLALHRHGWTARAPARIVLADARSGAVSVLFDDAQGIQISAATVGVLARGMLVMGAVRDEGLLVCGSPAP